MALDSGPWLWEDWLGKQDAPTFYIRPRTTEELIAYLEFVDLGRLHIRGVGAGHSTSDVARPWRRPNDAKHAGVVVRMDALALDYPTVAKQWWKPKDQLGLAPGGALFRVEAGATIEALNRRFFDHGLAFPNLGSYDQQNLAGALATGTHGSGLATGPLPDLVASIEMITVLPDGQGRPEVAHVRIEPADGPTDAAKFEAARSAGAHRMRLIAEDDAFYSAVVSMGFFGIVTAVTLELTNAFWLEETQALLPWSELKPKLPALAKQDYFDFVMSTRRTHQGPGGLEYKCLVSSRERVGSLGWGNPRDDARADSLRGKGMSRPTLTRYLANLASVAPRFANQTAVGVFEDEVERRHKSASHHIFRTSVGDLLFATSVEIAVPIDDVVTAVEAIHEHNRSIWSEGLNHTSPFGVRFSRGSKHYLAMAYGRDTCTIEAPMLLTSRAQFGAWTQKSSEEVVDEVLKRFVAAIRAKIPSVRLHHGQRNHDTRADLEAYPKFAQWHAQYRRFNSFGIFDNEASARWNL